VSLMIPTRHQVVAMTPVINIRGKAAYVSHCATVARGDAGCANLQIANYQLPIEDYDMENKTFNLVMSRKVVNQQGQVNYYNSNIGVGLLKEGENGKYFDLLFDSVPTDWNNCRVRLFPRTPKEQVANNNSQQETVV